MGKEIITNDKDINDLFLKVVNLVTQARERVATAVNIAEVYTKFHIGQYIVEYEQKGDKSRIWKGGAERTLQTSD